MPLTPAPPDPTVRAADPDDPVDLGQLRILEDEAREAARHVRGGQRWLEEHPSVGERWPQQCAESTVLVAHIGDVVVGYLVLDADGDVVRVAQVWVTEAARELGFGDALLAEAMQRGRAAGARLIEGSALPGDRATKNLYERAGIVARLIVTSKAL
jgi:GNAT superfamily N-acetyltransferase